MAGNWVWQSVVAMLILSPIWVAIGFFDKNYQVKSDVFLVWYFLVVSMFPIFFGNLSAKSLMLPWKILFPVLIVGFFGGVANILIFRAVAGAPNPGLPVAIGNGASIGSFLLVVLLSRLVPTHFNEVKFDAVSFLGIVLTFIGTAIVIVRK